MLSSRQFRIPTYDQFDRIAKAVHSTSLSSCEIADGKEQLGLPVKKAWNRKGRRRSITCPPWKLQVMKRIISDLNRNRR